MFVKRCGTGAIGLVLLAGLGYLVQLRSFPSERGGMVAGGAAVPAVPATSTVAALHPEAEEAKTTVRGTATPAVPVVAAPWPTGCGAAPVPMIFPNASADRVVHMHTVIARTGGCGHLVDAVMRDRVVSGTDAKSTVAQYEGSVIMHSLGAPSLAKGNVPNAATHMRMLNAAASSPGLADDDWVIFFEDDAQLHADVLQAVPTPDKVAELLRWSFEAADAIKANMITYSACISPKKSRCSSVEDQPELQARYPDIK